MSLSCTGARIAADLAQLVADLHGCLCRTRTAIPCADEPVWAHGSADLARGPGKSPDAGPARHEEPGRSRGTSRAVAWPACGNSRCPVPRQDPRHLGRGGTVACQRDDRGRRQGPQCCLSYHGSAGAIDRVITFIVNMRGLPAASHARHRDLRCARRQWATVIKGMPGQRRRRHWRLACTSMLVTPPGC